MELTKHVTLGVYLPTQSLVHRLDPRTKILISAFLVILAFYVETYTGYAFYLGFCYWGLHLCRIPFSFALKGFKPMLPILIVMWIFQLFLYTTPQAEVLYSVWLLEITDAGLRMGNIIVLRVLVLYSIVTLLTFTTSMVELTYGMEALLQPFRKVGVPAQELAMVMVIALRFVPTLAEELEKIVKAQMARGVAFDRGNFLRRAKSIFGVFLPLFVNAYKRGEDLIVAMEARNYTGGAGRTKMKHLKMSRRDLMAAGVILVFSILLMTLVRYLPPPY